MFKNYFKIAWRNILHNKVYTAINVLGLAIGICTCIVIFLITNFEFGFDKFHPDRDRIFRIVGEIQNNTGEKIFLNNLVKEVAGFQNQISGFEAEAGFHEFSGPLGGSISIANGNGPAKKFENKIAGTFTPTTIVTWPQYFDVFNYQWLEGNASTLHEPFKVVLTESRARKYFGDIPMDKIIGKTVTYDDSLQVSVSGIVKDWTGNTDFGFTDFISVSTATHSFLRNAVPTEDWRSMRPHNGSVFVKLAKGVSPAQINKRFATYIKDHVKFADGTKLSMWLQPLKDIHFAFEYRRGDDGDDFRKVYAPTLYVLIGVAIFILLIAAINFVNLSTAQSIQRTKEMGVRKVFGSGKIHIRLQFLAETLVLVLLAVLVSVFLVQPMLQLFKNYVPVGITFHVFELPTLAFLLAVTAITTLLAGFYPAKVLADYLPALSLKGQVFQQITSKLNLRKILIVFQFSMSLIFIICVLVMKQQMNFMMLGDKGFNTDAIITLNKWRGQNGKLQLLSESISQIPDIKKVQLQAQAPMGFAQMMSSYTFKGKENIPVLAVVEPGDEGFIPFYQMKLIAGRNIQHSDSLNEIVINETFAKRIGFDKPLDALSKLLYMPGPSGEKAFPIVGVVADFHQGSFHDAILPAVIGNMPNEYRGIAIKLSGSEKNTAEVKKILSKIEKQWKGIYPDTPFDYSFLNESISWLYGQEEKTAWLLEATTVVTIFISCMGLFGLSLFTARRRTKEIGIRKVMGASVSDITAMLSRDFIVLIVIAFAIASPIAWYFSRQWLQDFAYRVEISWWIFLAAGISAILIALLTISFQAIKAAVANPVRSLRTE